MDKAKEIAARARSLVAEVSPHRLGAAADGGLLAEELIARRKWAAEHTDAATIEEARIAYEQELEWVQSSSRGWRMTGEWIGRGVIAR